MSLAFGEPKNLAENSNNHYNNFQKLFALLVFSSLAIIFGFFAKMQIERTHGCKRSQIIFYFGQIERYILNIHQNIIIEQDLWELWIF